VFSSLERVGSVLRIGLLAPFPVEFPVWAHCGEVFGSGC